MLFLFDETSSHTIVVSLLNIRNTRAFEGTVKVVIIKYHRAIIAVLTWEVTNK